MLGDRCKFSGLVKMFKLRLPTAMRDRDETTTRELAALSLKKKFNKKKKNNENKKTLQLYLATKILPKKTWI
jgi:hypothetical protein